MMVTFQLPDPLGIKLKNRAAELNIGVTDLLVNWLSQRLAEGDADSPEQIVAHIQAAPPKAQLVVKATRPLAELLNTSVPPPEFASDTWDREWATIEAAMKKQYRADEAKTFQN